MIASIVSDEQTFRRNGRVDAPPLQPGFKEKEVYSMKRIIAMCLLLTLFLSLCACGQRISQEEAIAIALEEVESQTGLDLTVDMADCEKITTANTKKSAVIRALVCSGVSVSTT